MVDRLRRRGRGLLGVVIAALIAVACTGPGATPAPSSSAPPASAPASGVPSATPSVVDEYDY